MNRAKTIRTRAERFGFESKIDDTLSAEDELIPSSGFLAAVMDRVQKEASAPPPIPFPWKRALPGILASAGVFGWLGYQFFHQVPQLLSLNSSTSYVPFQAYLPAALAASANQAEWVGVALGVSLLSWLFARRLAGRGGLL